MSYKIYLLHGLSIITSFLMQLYIYILMKIITSIYRNLLHSALSDYTAVPTVTSDKRR